MSETKLKDTLSIAIGNTITQLLREWTTDIEKAIDDKKLAEDTDAVMVPLGLKIKLNVRGDDIQPTLELKFSTGKKIADTAEVNPNQLTIPEVNRKAA